MSRLRYAGVVGTIGSGNLTNSATSHTFTAPLTYGNALSPTTLPTLAGSDYFLLSILDTSGNLSEVVKVTAYNSGTGAATIVRGQEGTSGVAHTSGNKVTMAAYPSDLSYIGVKAYRSAAYAFANASVTVFPWDAEDWDTDAFHDNSTNNGRLTVPTGLGGRYEVNAAIALSTATTGRFLIGVQKNAADVHGGRVESVAAASTGQPCLHVSVEVDLADTDYVQVIYFIGTSSQNADTALCAFSMRKIG